MAIWIQIARALNQAGQECGLRERDVLQVFGEIGLRRFPEAGGGERSALSHRHLVGIELKICFFEKRSSSSTDINISASLRLSFFSGERKNRRAACMVMVEPPWRFSPSRRSISAAFIRRQ